MAINSTTQMKWNVLKKYNLPKLTQKEVEKLNSPVYNRRNNFELKFYTCAPQKNKQKKKLEVQII